MIVWTDGIAFFPSEKGDFDLEAFFRFHVVNYYCKFPSSQCTYSLYTRKVKPASKSSDETGSYWIPEELFKSLGILFYLLT